MTDGNPPINTWFSGGVEYIDRRRPDGQIETRVVSRFCIRCGGAFPSEHVCGRETTK